MFMIVNISVDEPEVFGFLFKEDVLRDKEKKT